MQPPALSFAKFLGYLPQLFTNRAEAIRQIGLDHGEIVRVPVPGKPFYLLTRPDFAHRVLQTNSTNYRKSFDFRIVRTFLGDGLITIHDDVWKHARTAGAPAVHQNHLPRAMTQMVSITDQALSDWGGGVEISALHAMQTLSLKIFSRVLFDIDISEHTDRIQVLLLDALRHLDDRLTAVVDFAAFMPTPSLARFKRARAELDEIVYGWIDERMATECDGPDLLSTVIRASASLPEDADAKTWRRDQVMTYLIAGTETCAVSMSWCLYLLAQNPDVQASLREEALTVLGDEPPTFEKVQALELSRKVVRETFRLYPPVWSLGREAVEADDGFDGFEVPAGGTVVLSPYAIHRKPEVWDEPEQFRPERWESPPDKAAGLVFFPFSSGPRFCFGERLAMLEMVLVLSMMMRKFNVTMNGEQNIGVEALISMRPKPDVQLELQAVA